jgi:hypothetical protein
MLVPTMNLHEICHELIADFETVLSAKEKYRQNYYGGK